MAQFFRGNLAGLIIRSGKLENKKVIDCLYTCKEGLDVQLPEEVASSVKVRAGMCRSQAEGSCVWQNSCYPVSKVMFLWIKYDF